MKNDILMATIKLTGCINIAVYNHGNKDY